MGIARRRPDSIRSFRTHAHQLAGQRRAGVELTADKGSDPSGMLRLPQHETVWPWYSHVAPVSWLLQRDVNGGRSHLNFTEWEHPQKHAKDVTEEVKEGEMPP
jgi:hypothetical protein